MIWVTRQLSMRLVLFCLILTFTALFLWLGPLALMAQGLKDTRKAEEQRNVDQLRLQKAIRALKPLAQESQTQHRALQEWEQHIGNDPDQATIALSAYLHRQAQKDGLRLEQVRYTPLSQGDGPFHRLNVQFPLSGTYAHAMAFLQTLAREQHALIPQRLALKGLGESEQITIDCQFTLFVLKEEER
jgi:hypothetical protein